MVGFQLVFLREEEGPWVEVLRVEKKDLVRESG
jgi:hypothetical protein